MKKIYLILSTVFILLFSGCNDLEEEIFSDFQAANFFENEDQIETQALGLYETFSFVQWEAWLWEMVTLPSQYTVTRVGNESWWAYTVNLASTVASRQGRFNTVWSRGFSAINRANNMITELPSSTFAEKNPDLTAQYIAEARWMRAYAYFNLVQLWGDLPLYTTATTSVDEEVLFRGRSPKEDIYELIIEDLIFASENLPVVWERTPRGRAVKSSAQLLLGKVYLTSAGLPLQQTENYQKAIDALKPLADNPEDFDVELLSDWASIFNKDNEDNKEIIFALTDSYIDNLGSVLPFYTMPRQSGLAASNGNYLVAHAPEILDLYEEDDVRLRDGFIFSYTRVNNGQTVTYNPTRNNFYGGDNGISGTKFMDPDATRNNGHEKDAIVYRYVDAFIMLAEAYNEINDQANALQYLNIARNRVNASQVTTTDQEELRQIIRDERIREFYEEYTELYDMRRWGTAQENFENHPTRARRAPDLQWDDRFLLFPIPDQQVIINPNLLPNNPGW